MIAKSFVCFVRLTNSIKKKIIEFYLSFIWLNGNSLYGLMA